MSCEIRLLTAMVANALCVVSAVASAAGFQTDVRPLLQKYCLECHSGDDASGEVDFTAIGSLDDVADTFETWDAVVEHLKARTMPPHDEPQPTDEERQRVFDWYRPFIASVETRPAVFKPRRLSVIEYRNTLRSVFGFDLVVAIIEAEQTVAERSLVIKLLPTDPPGKSGFTNDTHANPLTTVVWDQYAYLIDVAVEQLFSDSRRQELERIVGPVEDGQLTHDQAFRLLEVMVSRAWRRPVPSLQLGKVLARLNGRQGDDLTEVVKFEIKATLMSPHFMYRGLLVSGEPGKRQAVDDFELAERLSYFLWGDMPDERLHSLAASGVLTDTLVYASEVDRLLASPKSWHLANVFATEWMTLNEIEHVSDNVPKMVALKSQPTDFIHYLFTENRPLMELVDSRVAFINPHTSRLYGRDAKQMTKYVKQKGIEVEIVPNQRIQLEETTERGGILTMPGILAMNKGPILRGTWILERILGEELPDPPANVGQVPANARGENLSFRERFEQHRSSPACAACHDKIDPLGFALQNFDDQGRYLSVAGSKSGDAARGDKVEAELASSLDTSGRLPTGETFQDMTELKEILVTGQREAVIRNIVKRTMSFALCRELILYDQPSVEAIVEEMNRSNGTWRDLFLAIANSVPFRETILSKAN